MSGWGEVEQRAHVRAIEQQIHDARVARATAVTAGDLIEENRQRALIRNLQRERRSFLEGLGELPATRRNAQS